LSRLAVFSGGFTFDAAVAVAADEKIDETRVSDCIWELRSKSMIAVHNPRLSAKFVCRELKLSRSTLFAILGNSNLTFASHIR
jgi:predicted ATPase